MSIALREPQADSAGATSQAQSSLGPPIAAFAADDAEERRGPDAELRDIRTSLAFVLVEGVSRDDLEAAVGEVSRVRAALDACEAQCVAAIDGLDDCGSDAGSVLRQRSGCSQPAAKAVAGRAAALAHMPYTALALAGGRITAEHADVLIHAADVAGRDAVDASELLLVTAANSNVERTRRIANEWLRERLHTSTPHSRQSRRPMQHPSRTDPAAVAFCRVLVSGSGLIDRAEEWHPPWLPSTSFF